MANRTTRTISLTPEQVAFVTGCVDSGRYQSFSEVVRSSLRLLQDREQHREAQLARARELIRVGAEELDRGEVVDGEEFFRQLEAEDLASSGDAG